MMRVVAVVLALMAFAEAVDRSKFRTCQDTGFCRRYRSSGPTDQFSIEKSTVKISQTHFTANVASSITHKPPLKLEISFLESGAARFRLTQNQPRWQPTDLLQKAASAYAGVRTVSKNNLPGGWASRDAASFSAFASSASAQDVIVVQYSPLRVEVFRDGVNTIILNERNLMYYEQDQHALGQEAHNSHNNQNDNKHADRHKGKEVVDYGEDGLAIYADGTREERSEDSEEDGKEEKEHHSSGESFGGHSDSMPRGPRSVGFDISFPLAEEVYGLPEHTTPLSLPTTTTGSAQNRPARYTQPYRLYTLDVFEFELDEPMALYGTVPLLFGHPRSGTGVKGSDTTAGVFWFNPTETFVDISDAEEPAATAATAGSRPFYKQSRWVSESGEVDLFLLPGGPSPKTALSQFAALTGTQQLPPLWALGYHQCRWNYRDEKDVAGVLAAFEERDWPFDVLWLDIEHTRGKRYFTWDEAMFSNPIEMQRNVSALGRKMVTIVDPHIKRDDHYAIHQEATAKGLYIKQKDGKSDYDGWCWPGSSSYLDFTSPTVRAWWSAQFTLDRYQGSTQDLYTWNDMNEPSVFNGPEVSMPKDCLSLAGIEHREWHNLYGIYMQMATMQGHIVRDEAILKALPSSSSSSSPLRPFVLTRSFWAGSQRFGALWTGDNKALWSHLKSTTPMLLAIGAAGLGFAGADVGGFFGEPEGPHHGAELMLRWFQAGSLQPFFRGHAHHDTQRREPYLFIEPYKSLIRQATILRYSLLPAFYTAFAVAYETGLPPMRGLYLDCPSFPGILSIDQQWLLGDSGVMAAPVVDQGIKAIQVTLPPVVDVCAKEGGQEVLPWYELETLKAVKPTLPGSRLDVPVGLETLPLYLRPGSVLPRKMRLRRSASLMIADPYSLVVTPGSCGAAEGLLYLDDEKSHDFEQKGQFAWRRLSLATNAASGRMTLSCTARPEKEPLAVAGRKQQDPNWAKEHVLNTVERVAVAGQARAPTRVTAKQAGIEQEEERELVFMYDAAARTVTVKKPDVRIALDWTLTFEY